MSASVLTHYNPDYELKLTTDASPYGIGCVISHVLPNKVEKPIAYASRTLSDAKKGYSQIEREGFSKETPKKLNINIEEILNDLEMKRQKEQPFLVAVFTSASLPYNYCKYSKLLENTASCIGEQPSDVSAFTSAPLPTNYCKYFKLPIKTASFYGVQPFDVSAFTAALLSSNYCKHFKLPEKTASGIGVNHLILQHLHRFLFI
ncbi:hypothetical protein JTB14_011684 [Gonioctena quinquepunctata]|nr:hypothetical protein JTB14_011684 [Gonioctena quinquepunctata]